MHRADLRDCASTGERCARKRARTVRRGADGKGPTDNGRYLAGGLPYLALVLVGREGQGLDLEAVRRPQQPVEVDAERVRGELGVQAGAQAPEGVGVMATEVELLGQ